MRKQLVIYLDEDELQALRKDAVKDYRPLKLHVYFLLRSELVRRGLLQEQPTKPAQELAIAEEPG